MLCASRFQSAPSNSLCPCQYWTIEHKQTRAGDIVVLKRNVARSRIVSGFLLSRYLASYRLKSRELGITPFWDISLNPFELLLRLFELSFSSCDISRTELSCDISIEWFVATTNSWVYVKYKSSSPATVKSRILKNVPMLEIIKQQKEVKTSETKSKFNVQNKIWHIHVLSLLLWQFFRFESPMLPSL